MAQSPEERAFIAEFQARLRQAREGELRWSQDLMARRLGISRGAYIRYENRPSSAFPIFLLPSLAQLTNKPLHYWLGISADDVRKGRARLSVVDSSPH